MIWNCEAGNEGLLIKLPSQPPVIAGEKSVEALARTSAPTEVSFSLLGAVKESAAMPEAFEKIFLPVAWTVRGLDAAKLARKPRLFVSTPIAKRIETPVQHAIYLAAELIRRTAAEWTPVV